MIIETPYRAYPAIGQTDLKNCYEDPGLFFQVSVAKTRPQKPSTEAQVFGQDVEDFLFTGKLTDVVEIPSEVLSSNGARSGNKWKEWAENNKGARLLKPAEHAELKGALQIIRRNVAEHEAAWELLQAPRKKVAIAWHYAGLDLKSEIDLLHPESVRSRVHSLLLGIADLKTACDVRPHKFSAAISTYGLDVQAAAYQIAVEQEFGELLPFDFLVIQNEPSYQVETYRMHEEFLDLGRKKLNMLCDFYRACKENDDWHSETHGRLNWIRPHRYVGQQLEEWSSTG